jgi:hypothetical protein
MGENVATLDEHGPAIDVVEAGQAVEKGRLARSGWAHDRHELTAAHGEGDVVEGYDLPARRPIELAHIAGYQQRRRVLADHGVVHGRLPLRCPSGSSLAPSRTRVEGPAPLHALIATLVSSVRVFEDLRPWFEC